MCIIAAKPKFSPMPSDETLWRMWDANPGGAGFMYARDGKVRIEKGFMNFLDLMCALEEIEDPENRAVVLHLRRMKRKEARLCHPFPLDAPEDMTALSLDTLAGVVQNGIIRTEKRPFDETRNIAYTRRVLTPMYERHQFFMDAPDVRDLLWKSTDCRMAFLDHRGLIRLVGPFACENGVYYSNDTYTDRTTDKERSEQNG